MKYWNSSLSLEERVKDLFSQMTLEEKIAQLSSDIFPYGKDNFPVKLKEDGTLEKNCHYSEKVKNGIGGIAYVNLSLTPEDSVKYTNAIQRDIKENTRLGIPAFIFTECIYGEVAQGGTRYPLEVGLAATWDTELVQQVCSAVGKEVRSRGGNMTFSPVLDLGRDARWGRIEENFGEDVYLASRMAVAAVKGFQGGADVTTDHIAATLKHFAGFGQSQGGRQLAPCDIPPRMFKDEILAPFKAAVKEANPAGVMGSYCEVDGIPCHANKWLLTDVLRDEWGFTGVMVADFGGVDKLKAFHNIAETLKDAAITALLAGVDMDLPEGMSYVNLQEEALSNQQIMDRIDEAVLRVLRLKFKLGLFDNPYVDLTAALSIIHCEVHQELSQRSADESLVLLKNDKNLLPLCKDKLKSVAVIGPHSKLMDYGITIYDGIKEIFSPSIDVKWSQGCSLTDNDEISSYLQETEEAGFSQLHNSCFNIDEDSRDLEGINKPRMLPLSVEQRSIDETVAVAKTCDLAVLCLGESEHCSGENYAPNRFGDRDNLELIGNQIPLLKALKEAGVTVVTVLIHGRPLALGQVATLSDALLTNFNPGEMRGRAVAKALLGMINPSGKLPITMPISAGQVPCYYSQRPSGYTKEYAFTDGRHVFPFGYGLSYTTFSYDKLSITPEVMKDDSKITISVEVTNTGSREGVEVTQLYVRDVIASVTQPAMLLKGFKRINLKAGETKTVCLELKAEDLAFTNLKGEFKAEPGEFTVYVGSSSRKKDLISDSFYYKG